MIRQPVVGAEPEEWDDGDDQGKQQGGDDSTDERGPAPGERRSAEHRGGDAVQGVTAPDLGVADAGTCHHEEGGDGGEQGRQEKGSDPDPVGADATPLGRSLVEPDRPKLESRPTRVQPDIEEPGPDHDGDERHWHRTDASTEHGEEPGVDGAARRRSKSQRDPVEDAEGGERGDDRGDLHAADQAGVDQTDQEAGEQHRTAADQDLGAARTGRYEEGGDHHAQADHRPDREVEVADE